MTTTVFDTFTGTNGTDLSDHAPDVDVVGNGWNQSPVNGFELDGSGAAKWASSGNIALLDARSSDQQVTVNFTPGGADNRISVFARSNGALSTTTLYNINFRSGDAGGTVKLYKVVSGSVTELASVSYAVTLGSTYEIMVEALGTSIKVYVNSVEIIAVTDSSITSGNYAGIGGYLRTNGNGRFYDFTVTDFAFPTTMMGVNIGTNLMNGLIR